MFKIFNPAETDPAVKFIGGLKNFVMEDSKMSEKEIFNAIKLFLK